MRHALPIAALLAFNMPAMAQAVDEQGAAQLTETLKRYVGNDAFSKGVTTVVVDGDAYKLTLNIKSLVELLPKQALVKVEAAPYTLQLKPRGDGLWDVAGDLMPNFAFEMNLPEGKQTTNWSSVGGKFSGTYDPEMAYFANAVGTHESIKTLTISPTDHTEASFGPGKMTMEGRKSTTSGGDFAMTQTMSDFVETLKFNDPASGTAFAAAVKSPSLAMSSKGTGLQTKPLLDLWAFLVANTDEAKLRANQGELKRLLLAALPLWERIDGSYGFNDMAVESPVGNFSAKTIGLSMGMDGIRKDGTLNYGFSLSALNMPAQLLPAWSAPLLPTDVSLNFGGENLNSEDFVKKAIDAFDLNNTPQVPEPVSAQLASDFMASNPKVIIHPSSIKNNDIALNMRGEVVFPNLKPEMNAIFDATGFNKVIEALTTASKTEPEVGQMYLPMALAAQSLDKAQADGSLQWVVNVKADGAILVNGAMVKPADPVVEQGQPEGAPAEPAPQ